MINTGWKRTTSSPYWGTTRHDRAGMPETQYPVSESCLSSFLFRKNGIFIAQAHARDLRIPEMTGNRKPQNGSFHAFFGTFGSQNGTSGWSKTKSHHGHHTRLSGSYFRCVGAFSKSGADTAALGWNQEETIGEDQIDPCSQSHSRKAT